MGTAQGLIDVRALRGDFYHRLEERTAKTWIPTLAMMEQTDQNFETFKHLGMVPALEEFVGGRRLTSVDRYELTIRPKKFDRTLQFSRDELTLDKTGQVRIRIGDLAARAATFPQKHITAFMVANSAAYDGTAFFGNHTSASVLNNAQQLNIATIAEPTSEEMKTAILQAIETLIGAVDDSGEPMNEDAMNFLVMVPTGYWHAAAAALQTEFTSAGVSNTLKDLMARGLMVNYVVNPRLAATPYFYVFRTDSMVKPFIWLDKLMPTGVYGTEFKTLGEGSDHSFKHNEHLFSAERDSGIGFGAFECACRVEFT